MKSLLVTLALCAGCFGNAAELSGVADDGPQDGFGAVPGQCGVDSDCVPAGASCCDCPTFATTIDDPKVAACEQVDCDTNVCSTNVAATCDPVIHECVLACAPLTCLECPSGYETEANGCLSCTCAAPPPTTPECVADNDCVRVRADCCGCDNGGEDTAVPQLGAAGFDASLNCSSTPTCPGMTNQSCDPTAQARCIRGACALATEPMPDDACGRADLPACPAGTTCQINVSDSASLYGVGVCRP